MGDYEKIPLSKQDLRYVYSQILQQTTSKLDLHLPTSNKDPLKNKVAAILDEFLMGAFELAKSGLLVDGSSIDEPVLEMLSLKRKETVEPFDLATNSQLREILLQVEQETVRLTELRRELPERARGAYEELVSKTDSEVTTILTKLEADAEEPEDGSIPNLEEIKSDYERHVLLLHELKKSIPDRKAELDKYDDTILFLEEAYNRQVEEAKDG